MNGDRKLLQNVVGRALSDKGAHVATAGVFSGLDAEAAGARPGNLPHSLFEILGHVVFWQDWVVEWLKGGKLPVPKHASGSWPRAAAPENAAEWRNCVRRFQAGLKELERHARQADLAGTIGKHSRARMLHDIAAHNSYHIGQAVVLRQMLGKWPPPFGGLTW
ncbi:MAG TPA: DinB family protein [Candidatus Sulfopaludibacter sp.]|nr:DinB family protein [Candidatus Sulfopaludibacter sp.]